ncbi:hypothetical protein [Halarcobacter bivalviorum]|uniref:Transglycosylase SLT domain-containing protein n=1 Tax=Halarcobacter bivalviorum TaxID=663364 RepID=A0AAX2AA99_9BACT|nr:hypothetical protein [Halarcobacter bivalviorum]AXH12307.1 hypothetical protein ABIV_1311 [Halarcobacter bivalviorum]RXK10760.1 hypothetical protein CRV05_05640 [Halarcobacter bivalviorum]
MKYPSSLFLITLLSSSLYASNFLSLDTIEKEKKGIKRDFLINEFLKKEATTSEEAFSTLQFIDNMNTTLFTNFANKYADDETLAVVQCMNMPTNQLLSSYDDCIRVGLSYNEISKLNSLEAEQIINITSEKYPKYAKKVKLLSSSIPFTRLITLEKDEFYELYLNISNEFRENYFNYKLPRKTFFKIFEDKENFEKYLEVNIKNRKLDILNYSLLAIDETTLSANASFLLGLNAFAFNEKDKAQNFFLNALAKDKENQNKILFWLYKTTKNDSFLKDIIQEKKIDIYTILSYEILKEELVLTSNLNQNNEFIKATKNYKIGDKAFLYAMISNESNFNNKFISKDFKIGLLNTKYDLIDIEKFFLEGLPLEKSLKLIENNFFEENRDENIIIKYLLFKKEKEKLEIIYQNEESDRDFIFEILSDKKLKEFLFTYYSFYNLKSKKKETLSSIFENLK